MSDIKPLTFAYMAGQITELIGEDFTHCNNKLGREVEEISKKAYIAVRRELDKPGHLRNQWNNIHYFIQTFYLASITWPDEPLFWNDYPSKKKEESSEGTNA